MIIVTGGAGFIGSNFILQQIQNNKSILNLDSLTYAGNLMNLTSVEENPNYHFVKGSITDSTLLKELFEKYRPEFI